MAELVISVLISGGSIGVARIQVSTVTLPPKSCKVFRYPALSASSVMMRLEVTRNCMPGCNR